MKIQIRSNIEKGLIKRNRNLVLEAIKYFDGKDVLITFEKPKKTRSNPQNSYYWGVVIPLIQKGLLDATAELRNAESIHYKILLPLFAPEKEIINKDTGESCFEKQTSSDLTTTQFCEYIMEIQKWGAEFLGIDIPSPNEEIMLDFKE